MNVRPRVLICCNSNVRETFIAGEGVARLDVLADWEWLASEGTIMRPDVPNGPSDDPADAERLRDRLAGYSAMIVCHGAPYVDAEMLAQAPDLRFIGDLNGDRFANRIDADAAAERGIRVVDTTNASSLAVAEWALGLALNGLRSAGEHFRRLLAGEEYQRPTTGPGFRTGELTGRTVGLIGLGHISRHLIDFLRPFRCRLLAYDPYVPKEVAVALGVWLTTLDRLMADTDVVVCCVPHTPRTERMVGAHELGLLRPDSVFVNVSRGAVVDSDALVARARRGDARFALDVFEPEPIPAEHPIRRLPNVFLSPHIAGITAASRTRAFSLMVEELERFFGGHETLFDLTPRVLASRRGTLIER